MFSWLCNVPLSFVCSFVLFFSIDHCIACLYSCFLLTIVLPVSIRVFYWPLYCLSLFVFSIDHCIACLYSCFLLTIVLPVSIRVFYWPLYCLSLFVFSIDHCIACLYSCFLLTIVLPVFIRVTGSDDYPLLICPSNISKAVFSSCWDKENLRDD